MNGTSGKSINGVLLDGVRLDNGATLSYTGDLEAFDAVAPSANPGEVTRAANGVPFLGWTPKVEKDGVCTVYRSPEYVTLKRSGAVPNGMQVLVGDGDGGVKAAASAAAGTLCHVVQTFADGGDKVQLAILGQGVAS